MVARVDNFIIFPIIDQTIIRHTQKEGRLFFLTVGGFPGAFLETPEYLINLAVLGVHEKTPGIPNI